MKRIGWRSLAVVAVALVGVMLAVWRRDVPTADGVVTAALPTEVAGPQAPPSPRRVAVSNEGTATAPAIAKPTRADAPVWDLCGFGKLPVPPGSSASAAANFDLPLHLGAIPTGQLYERTLAALKQGTPRQRAAASVLNMDPEQVDSAAAQLAQLALSSRDPVALSWAWTRCRSKQPCAEGLARAWTQIEPSNVTAWLALAQDEPKAAAEARAGLVAAKHYSLRGGLLVHEAMKAVPPDAEPYLRQQLAVVVTGIEAALSMPTLQPLSALCMPPPPPGSERQATCGAMATMVIEHSDSLLGHATGIRMGERAGWPAPRLAELRAEQMRLEAALLNFPMDKQQPMSCESVDRVARSVHERGELGELAYLKRQAALRERR